MLVLSTPQTSLSITKDLSLTAGSNGTAAMSDFSNYYSHTVPEPRAISIVLGIMLFGAVVFHEAAPGSSELTSSFSTVFANPVARVPSSTRVSFFWEVFFSHV